MANVITINKMVRTRGQLRVQGTVVLSGSYVAAPTGEVLDFTKAVAPLGETLPASTGPTQIDLWGNTALGYEPIGPLPPTTALKVPIKITSVSISGTTPTVTELGAGAYNAAITGDFIQFEAVFPLSI